MVSFVMTLVHLNFKATMKPHKIFLYNWLGILLKPQHLIVKHLWNSLCFKNYRDFTELQRHRFINGSVQNATLRQLIYSNLN